jgi:hypothetical protein
MPATGACLARLRVGGPATCEERMIRKLKSGKYRLYSKKKDPRTGKRRNLGTFATREQAQQHEKAVQFFKRQG